MRTTNNMQGLREGYSGRVRLASINWCVGLSGVTVPQMPCITLFYIQKKNKFRSSVRWRIFSWLTVPLQGCQPFLLAPIFGLPEFCQHPAVASIATTGLFKLTKCCHYWAKFWTRLFELTTTRYWTRTNGFKLNFTRLQNRFGQTTSRLFSIFLNPCNAFLRTCRFVLLIFVFMAGILISTIGCCGSGRAGSVFFIFKASLFSFDL